jgi:hypothetical protein
MGNAISYFEERTEFTSFKNKVLRRTFEAKRAEISEQLSTDL